MLTYPRLPGGGMVMTVTEPEVLSDLSLRTLDIVVRVWAQLWKSK